MKTINEKMKSFGKFGFGAINAGQRNTTVEPQLIVTSTEGTFRLTPPVTKALGLAHGDYVMFIQNKDNISLAITNQEPELVEYCNEHGLDITSSEAAIAIHKEFDMVGIAKGIKEFDAKGNFKVVTERLSKKDKETRISQNYDEYVSMAMENASPEVKDAISRDGITKEEVIDILIDYVQAEELPKYKGSKAANPTALAGIGTTLNFTDTNVWKELKSDLNDDEAVNINREFNINLDEIQSIDINNGYKDVTVNVLFLNEYVDKEPVRRVSKSEKADKEPVRRGSKSEKADKEPVRRGSKSEKAE